LIHELLHTPSGHACPSGDVSTLGPGVGFVDYREVALGSERGASLFQVGDLGCEFGQPIFLV
jgi:hypothetical protein